MHDRSNKQGEGQCAPAKVSAKNREPGDKEQDADEKTVDFGQYPESNLGARSDKRNVESSRGHQTLIQSRETIWVTVSIVMRLDGSGKLA